jgi:hypothetical protein
MLPVRIALNIGDGQEKKQCAAVEPKKENIVVLDLAAEDEKPEPFLEEAVKVS